MMTGQMDATAVTSKEFMLTPNLPRFVRVGDHTSMAASVSNLTGKNLSGTVKLVLFDPMTDQEYRPNRRNLMPEPDRVSV